MLKCDSIKLLCNSIEITPRQGSSPVNLKIYHHEKQFVSIFLKSIYFMLSFRQSQIQNDEQ